MKRYFLLNHFYSLCIILTLSAGAASAQDESDFYKDSIHLVDKTVNLVTDYGANGNDSNDDSPPLQTAVDDMTALTNGGKVIIPSGTFYLIDIKLKDNVHLVIDSNATIVPFTSGVIFKMGLDRQGADAAVTIKNVSIRGDGGRYTIDLTSIPAGDIKMSFANCRNVDNFMIADFNVLDNWTRLSSVTLNLAEYNGQYFRARNGVVKNGHVDKGHFGYGLVQCQVGYHILFKNLSGVGGLTLRLETGAVATAPPDMNLDDIYGRNISCTDGHAAFAIGPHDRQNGHVDIDSAISYGCLRCGGAGAGTGGSFASTSIIKNVHAVYGENAQMKPKSFNNVPCELRDLISSQPNPDGESYKGPSIKCVSDGTGSNWDPTFINITHEGFLYQQEALVVDDVEVTNAECETVTASYTYTANGLTANFDGSGSSDANGTISSWFWHFGDGTTGSGQLVSHTYNTAGTYTVYLQVTDNNSATNTDEQEITVKDPANLNHVASLSTFPFSVSRNHSRYAIKLNTPGQHTIHILNLKGDVIRKIDAKDDKASVFFLRAAGVYVLHIKSGGEKYQQLLLNY